MKIFHNCTGMESSYSTPSYKQGAKKWVIIENYVDYLEGAATLLLLSSCAPKEASETIIADANYQETLQTQLLDAKPGDVITIPEGVFSFDRSLSLTVDGVTIRGAGMDKSILSFKNQVTGAEGLLVHGQ